MNNVLHEEIVVFESEKHELLGIYHPASVDRCELGVLLIVGGPQYRVGSHRQFVLLARFLAQHGIPVFRFDYQGMGDSGGSPRTFEFIGSDVRAALDAFVRCDAGIEKFVLWGLCDAASASLFYAHQDSRIVGLVLLNPWVRTERGEAKARLKHYYLSRLFSKELVVKVIKGKFDIKSSLSSLYSNCKKVFEKSMSGKPDAQLIPSDAIDSSLSLPGRMLKGLKLFRGKVLIILSGNDLTADEFIDTVNASSEWQACMHESRVTQIKIENANHTFSSKILRGKVENATLSILRELARK